MPNSEEQSPFAAAFARTERALRESEARLQALFETAVDGMIIIDPRGSWGRVELDTLVDQSLAPYRAPGSAPRIVSEGPKVLLPTRAVVPLSMVLHELATNAAKYGALSVDCGSLEVRWGVVERDKGHWVELRWIERDGPPAATDIKEGFGTKLIRRSVSYDLDGQADLLFAADRLKGTLAFPIPEDPALAALSAVVSAHH
jgi:two-component sensor histidine kinase